LDYVSVGLIRALLRIGAVHAHSALQSHSSGEEDDATEYERAAQACLERARAMSQALPHAGLQALALHELGLLLSREPTLQPSASTALKPAAQREAEHEQVLATRDSEALNHLQSAQTLRTNTGAWREVLTTLNAVATALMRRSTRACRSATERTTDRARAGRVWEQCIALSEALGLTSAVASAQCALAEWYAAPPITSADSKQQPSAAALETQRKQALQWFERSRMSWFAVRANVTAASTHTAVSGGSAAPSSVARELSRVWSGWAAVQQSLSGAVPSDETVHGWTQSVAWSEQLLTAKSGANGDESEWAAIKARNSLASTLFARKEYSQALPLLLHNQSALNRMRSSAARTTTLISTLWNLGSLHAAIGQHTTAVDELKAASEHYAQTNQPTQLCAVLAELAECFKALSRTKEAIEAYTKAANLAQLLGNKEHSQLMRKEVDALKPPAADASSSATGANSAVVTSASTNTAGTALKSASDS
jgi:tetratricopeptide (TPR) repeat protein